MDPKLIEAIAVRIRVGHSKEQIQSEMLKIGYDDESFFSAYNEAQVTSTNKSPSFPSETEVVQIEESGLPNDKKLPPLKRLLVQSFGLFRDTYKVLVKGIITFIATLISAGVVGILLMTFLPVVGTGSYIAKFVALLIFLIFTFLALTACLSAVVRGLLKRSDKQRYSRHFGWTYLNIVSIILVTFYVNMLTQAGMALFVIPGIMLSVYLIFSSYFVLGGEKKGIAALVASTKLVYGHFWPVWWRVLASVFILTLVIALSTLLISTLALVKTFFVPTVILLIVIAFISALYWQLCFMIVLFESLKEVSVAKEIPLAEKRLSNIYLAVIIFSLLLSLFLFFTLEPDEERSDNPWTYKQIVSDINKKNLVKEASEKAFIYKEENGSYLGLCDVVSLPKNTSCESTETTFIFKSTLSSGHYCFDSTGYNEVRSKSKDTNSLCQSVDSQ